MSSVLNASRALLIAGLLLGGPGPAFAVTVPLPSNVDGDLRIESDQVAQLREDVLVSGTLTFEAGSRLEIRAVKPVALIVRGKLLVSGTQKQPVLLGAGAMRPGRWKGVLVDGQIKLSWATIQGAETGITARKGSTVELDSVMVRWCNMGISAINNITLDNCLIAKNSGDGVYVVSDNVVLRKTSLLLNDGWGLRTGHHPTVKLEECTVIGNSAGGLRLGSTEGKDASCEATKCNIHDNGSVDISNADRGREVKVDGCYLGATTTREIERKGEKANLTRIIDLFDGAVAPVTLSNTAKEKIKDAGCSLDTRWLRHR